MAMEAGWEISSKKELGYQNEMVSVTKTVVSVTDKRVSVFVGPVTVTFVKP